MSEDKDVYGQDLKKIIFKDTAKRHAELKTKLQYDSLNQTKFFKLCISAYLEDSESMREIIGSVQTNKTQKKKIQKNVEEAADTKKTFALDELEVDNIFDIIEAAHPEL